MQTAVIFAQAREGKAAGKRSSGDPDSRYLARLVTHGFQVQLASGGPSWRHQVCEFHVQIRQKADSEDGRPDANCRGQLLTHRPIFNHFWSSWRSLSDDNCRGQLLTHRHIFNHFWSSWGSLSDANCRG